MMARSRARWKRNCAGREREMRLKMSKIDEFRFSRISSCPDLDVNGGTEKKSAGLPNPSNSIPADRPESPMTLIPLRTIVEHRFRPVEEPAAEIELRQTPVAGNTTFESVSLAPLRDHFRTASPATVLAATNVVEFLQLCSSPVSPLAPAQCHADTKKTKTIDFPCQGRWHFRQPNFQRNEPLARYHCYRWRRTTCFTAREFVISSYELGSTVLIVRNSPPLPRSSNQTCEDWWIYRHDQLTSDDIPLSSFSTPRCAGPVLPCGANRFYYNEAYREPSLWSSSYSRVSNLLQSDNSESLQSNSTKQVSRWNDRQSCCPHSMS
ncbi:hypothetical protein PM082_023035 [Marasmius tenuissimus]|nr:hypothetical protein PM082_023035 [Marasmius tenuissimus]